MDTKRKYWIIVASKDHVKKAEQGGFIQANHGKKASMQKLQKGDRILCYSSKVKYGEPKPYQKFTAIGSVIDNEPSISDIMENTKLIAFRRKVNYDPCRKVNIKPLINRLNFIRNEKKWGFPFRRGFFEISKEDYLTIANEMTNDA